MEPLCKGLLRLHGLASSTNFVSLRLLSQTTTRHSQYDWSLYQEPILDKRELEKPLAETDKRRHLPVRAMRHEETPTFWRDPILHKFAMVCADHSDHELGQRLIFNALERVKLIQLKRYRQAKTEEERAKIDCNPRSVFHKAIVAMTPKLKLVKYIRGGVTYQVPAPCPTEKGARFIGMKMMRDTCAYEKPRTMRFYDMLARELIDAGNNEGKSILKKQDLHRKCEANRAYAHFRWQ